MEQYFKLDKLGEGRFASVYKAKDEKNGEFVAVKKFRTDLDQGIPVTEMRQISYLKVLKHENIVTLHDVRMYKNRLYLIFEYLEMNLRAYLNMLPSKKPMDRSVLKSFLHQITDAILFSHGKGIMHCDLKPQNLLLSDNGIIKVADFGMARGTGLPLTEYSQQMTTLWYTAPELLLNSPQYSFPIDIWSLGCIFAEMARRLPLFYGESKTSQLFQIFQVLTTPTEKIWPGVTSLPGYRESFPNWSIYKLFKQVENLEISGLDLLRRMLTYDPAQRITAREMMQHDYFVNMKLRPKPSQAHAK